MRQKYDRNVTKIRHLKPKDAFVHENTPYLVIFDNENSRVLYLNMKTCETAFLDPDTFVLKANIETFLED